MEWLVGLRLLAGVVVEGGGFRLLGLSVGRVAGCRLLGLSVERADAFQLLGLFANVARSGTFAKGKTNAVGAKNL